ncbi:MAG: TIM barrel protein [Actinobacteria bacterium]|nr:TIM barrel protein [Actinomycetota bacterium]
MSDFLERVASAPISWGVCEVPGWGAMLPAERVLGEMSGLGLRGTELGAPGFLPSSAAGIRALLDRYGMSLLGAFTPVVPHDPALVEASMANAREVAGLLRDAGATMFISAPVMDPDWSVPRPLDADERRRMLGTLARLDDLCAEFGLTQVLHPHVQTLVETADDVAAVLDGCDVRWCLDTGHLAIGGVDPVAFARDAVDRVGHVHLKDVRMALAPAVLRRETSIMAATQAGLFTPLGQGDVDIAGVVETLEAAGYRGRYVIEQDTALTTGAPAAGEGPVTQVRASLDYLRDVVAPRLSPGTPR